MYMGSNSLRGRIDTFLSDKKFA